MRQRLKVNGHDREVDASDGEALLWVLRERLGLTGPKYGCGVGVCGACVSLVDGQAFRPCVTPVEDAAGRDVVTIEGLSDDGDHPVQRAWLQLDVAQCGYCQPGQIMSTVALLAQNPNPDDEDIDRALRDNVCRCGTYRRVRDAVRLAARLSRKERD